LSNKEKNSISAGIKDIKAALRVRNFADDNNLSDYGLYFYADITNAINDIDDVLSNLAVRNIILYAFELLYEGSARFAENAIDYAGQNCTGDNNCIQHIKTATNELGKAMREYEKGNYINVFNHLTNSWKHAQFALGTKLKKTGETLPGIPNEFSIDQNYPNPFNPSTRINYQVPELSAVSIKVYDILGNLVTTLVDEVLEPGYYNVEWNADKLSSGVYFYSMKSGSYTSTKKLLLLK
jgi:hypothetical protein